MAHGKKDTKDLTFMSVGFWTTKFSHSNEYSFFKHIWLTYEALRYTEPITGDSLIIIGCRLPVLRWVKMTPEELAGIEIDLRLLAWKWHVQGRNVKHWGQARSPHQGARGGRDRASTRGKREHPCP